MNFKYIISSNLVFIILFISSCSNPFQSKSKKDNTAAIAALALATTQSSSSTTTLTTYTCTSKSLVFSDFTTAIKTSTCLTCHTGTGSSNTSGTGLDLSTYSLVSQRVTASSPSASLLYQKIANGNGNTMAQYANDTIKQTTYCWILGGAKP